MVKEDLSLFYRKIDDILPEKTTLNIAFIHLQGTSTYKEFSDDYKKEALIYVYLLFFDEIPDWLYNIKNTKYDKKFNKFPELILPPRN